jgi:hypothetical protein
MCLASGASEMCLRKISPRLTYLYPVASMLLGNASAAAQSLDSNPKGGPLAKVVTHSDSYGLEKMFSLRTSKGSPPSAAKYTT